MNMLFDFKEGGNASFLVFWESLPKVLRKSNLKFVNG